MRTKIEHLNEIYPSVKRDLHCLDLVAGTGKSDFPVYHYTGKASCTRIVFSQTKNYANGKFFFENYGLKEKHGSTCFFVRSSQMKSHSFESNKGLSFCSYTVHFGHTSECDPTRARVQTNRYDFY